MRKYECADPSLQEAFDNGTLGYYSRPKSKFPPMSMYQRASQFRPFAALKGYEECIDDASRYVIVKKELAVINKKKLII